MADTTNFIIEQAIQSQVIEDKSAEFQYVEELNNSVLTSESLIFQILQEDNFVADEVVLTQSLESIEKEVLIVDDKVVEYQVISAGEMGPPGPAGVGITGIQVQLDGTILATFSNGEIRSVGTATYAAPSVIDGGTF